ncbi:MAG TPA: carboxypeptidase regulatory-like domain-containing protein [Pyrinomonadaceae bacterium]|nr:carboxypeptidase regulatory-like domain-containing protein [Pyrinomonadaceae bacterium]
MYATDVMMPRMRKVLTLIGFLVLAASTVSAQDKATGGLKGKVRVEVGNPSAVTVVVRQGEQEITRVATNKSGDFVVERLKPGIYGVTFRKPGLSVGTIENIEVKAGKTRSLGDRLVLTLDEGSIAFIRGSVFDVNGRSVPNARIELARIEADGNAKKIDGRITNEIGSFVFRLTPEAAKYRVTVKPKDGEAVSQDIDVDGAAVYRLALSIKP